MNIYTISGLTISLLVGIFFGARETLSIDRQNILNDNVTLPCVYDGPEWPPECQLGLNIVKYNPFAIPAPPVYQSLEIAINVANNIVPHGCVEIVAGQFNENVNLSNITNVIIYGQGSNTILNGTMAFGGFSNLRVANLSINAAQGSNASGIVLAGGSSAEVDRVEISNSASSGLFIIDSSDVFVHHIISKSNGNPAYGSGISIFESNNVDVECSTAYDNHGQGIEIDSSSEIVINGNRTYQNCDTGIGISDLSSRCYPNYDVSFSAGCVIAEVCSIKSSLIWVVWNETYNNASSGIGSDGADGLFVGNNIIHDNGTFSCSIGSSQTGIYLLTTYNFLVQGNTIYGNHGCASVVVNKCKNGEVSNNTVSGNEIAGMNENVIYPTAACGHIFSDLDDTSGGGPGCENSCNVPYINCGGWNSVYNPFTDANQNFVNCCRCGGVSAPTATANPAIPTVFVQCTPPAGTPTPRPPINPAIFLTATITPPSISTQSVLYKK